MLAAYIQYKYMYIRASHFATFLDFYFVSGSWHFEGIRNGTSGTRIKKVQKTDPPNVAILRPYETLGQVSEIGNYFLGYFIIFDVFPMYFPM